MKEGTIYFIVGPWASGKSTLCALLPSRLPEAVIFDWDLIIPGLSLATGTDVHEDASTWPGMRAIWAAILQSIASAGRDVILVGPVTPDDLFEADQKEIPTECLYLNWPDEVLAERLRQRNRSEEEIEDELQFAQSLRSSSWHAVNLSGENEDEMTDRVAAHLHVDVR